MTFSNTLERQGHRMLQLGVALVALSSLEGLVVPALPLPRLALSVHTLGFFQSLLFLALGLVWPRLRLSHTSAVVAWWSYVYSSVATLAAYVMAAFWGAGGSSIPLATGGIQGTVVQETAIRVALLSSAPTFLIALTLIIAGLRPAKEATFAARDDRLPSTAR
jgi:hypothetical protein